MKWGYWSLLLLGTAAFLVVLTANPAWTFPWSIAGLSAFAVGAAISWKASDNPIGRVLFAVGTIALVALGLSAVIADSPNTTANAWVDAVSNALNTAWIPLLAWVLLVFPDGELPPGRWRFVRIPIFGAVIFGFFAALLNGGWGGDPEQGLFPSPLQESTAPLGDVLSSIFFPLFLIGFLGAAASLIAKYRRSSGEARLQFKWLAYAAGFIVVAVVILLAANGFTDLATDQTWEAVLIALAFAAIPAAIGVAILKYRLYDIDVVINRTVVLALLAGFITAVYAGIVVGIGRLIGGEEGLLLPITATAIVALAFEPVRHWAQRRANRLVFGQRATPYEVLSDLTERLAHGEEGEGLLERLAQRLGDGTGAAQATVWLGTADAMRPVATWPADQLPNHRIELDAEETFPVTHDGELVGALEVAKPRGIGLSSSERALIGDVAGSAGAILGYRRLNDNLEEKASELSESRNRLVDAQDQERRRLERDLHDGAQQLIVALKVKIGLAKALASKHQASELELLLEGLSDEAQAALDEVRALARGIYPPVLESDGLGPAVSALVSPFPVNIEVSAEGIARYDRDVETAVYFDIAEAVTNAVKHAGGPIKVGLREEDGSLRFSVTDKGPGFDARSANGGSGLQNLKDRMDAVGGELEILSEPGLGTTVQGLIPLDLTRV